MTCGSRSLGKLDDFALLIINRELYSSPEQEKFKGVLAGDDKSLGLHGRKEVSGDAGVWPGRNSSRRSDGISRPDRGKTGSLE